MVIPPRGFAPKGLSNHGLPLPWLTCGLLAMAAFACTGVPTPVIYAPPESITACSHHRVGIPPHLLCGLSGAGSSVSSRTIPVSPDRSLTVRWFTPPPRDKRSREDRAVHARVVHPCRAPLHTTGYPSTGAAILELVPIPNSIVR